QAAASPAMSQPSSPAPWVLKAAAMRGRVHPEQQPWREAVFHEASTFAPSLRPSVYPRISGAPEDHTRKLAQHKAGQAVAAPQRQAWQWIPWQWRASWNW